MTEIASNMQGLRINVRNSVKDVHLFWEGRSAQAFTQVMEQWMGGQNRLETDIENLARAVRQAADRIREAELLAATRMRGVSG